MKKHLLLLMLFAGSLAAFTGCKKDDDASIEGTWKLTKYDYKYYENGELNEEESGSEDVTNNEWVYTIEVRGGKWSSKETNGTQEYVTTGTYVLSGNKLTVKEEGDDDDDVFTVKSLTDNTLVLVSEDVEEEDGVTYKEIYEDTYARQ